MTTGPTSRIPLHSTAKSRSLQEGSATAFLLLALTVLYFWKQVVLGKALYWGDIGLYFTPMTTFLRENLRTGHLPLWNPLIYCGTPYVGNPQTWLLYPFTVLLPCVSAAYFLSLTVAFHVWLAGVGMFLFARRAMALSFWPALLAALTFMFGGQFVAKEQFPNMVQAMAYLPWILWLTHRLLLRGRVQDSLALGAAFGLQLLAAHAQMTVLTLSLAFAYGLFAFQVTRLSVMRLLLAICIGVGLAAGQILPTLDLFHNAARHNLSFHDVNRFYLPVTQLLNFVLPNLHGNPYSGNFTARGNYWESCCYVGWLSFAAAILGAYFAWSRGGVRDMRFWSLVFVFGLWMALGRAGGLYHVAYWLIPGLRNFHDPARSLLWACFALSLLAGYGLQHILARVPHSRPFAITVLLLAFADLAHFGQALAPLADPAGLMPTPPVVAAVQADPQFQAHQARFLAPTSGVWLRFVSYKDYRQNLPGYPVLRADTLAPNLMMSYGLRDAFGYEPVALRTPETIVGAAAFGFDPKAQPYQKRLAAIWAGFLGVKSVVTCRTQPPEAALPGLAPDFSEPTSDPPGHHTGHHSGTSRIYLSQNTLWLPRARVTTDFKAFDTPQAAQAAMLRAEKEPNLVNLMHTTVLAGTVPFVSMPHSPFAAASIFENDADHITITTNTTAPAVLVLADTNSSGWQARLDGQPAEILTADGCLRAVILPHAGRHFVGFAYRPTAFLLGLYLTLLTVAILSCALTLFLLQNNLHSVPAKKDFLMEVPN